MTEPQNQIETYAPLVRAGLYALLLSPIGVLLGYGLTGMAGTKLATRLNVTKKQVDTVRTTLAVIFLLPSAILLILTLL